MLDNNKQKKLLFLFLIRINIKQNNKNSIDSTVLLCCLRYEEKSLIPIE